MGCAVALPDRQSGPKCRVHPAELSERISLRTSASRCDGEPEAYSFGDIDALAVVSYTDQGSSALAASSSAFSAKACTTGGRPVAPGGPGGYAPFGDPAGANAAVLNDATPVVAAAAALPKLTLNPCGDIVPFAKVAALNLTHLDAIKVPVLEIVGGGDQIFPASAGRRQAALFTGSSAVDLVTVPGAGHAITLQRGHGAFTAGMRTWLESVDGFAVPPPVGSTPGSATPGPVGPGCSAPGCLHLPVPRAWGRPSVAAPPAPGRPAPPESPVRPASSRMTDPHTATTRPAFGRSQRRPKPGLVADVTGGAPPTTARTSRPAPTRTAAGEPGRVRRMGQVPRA